VPLPAQTSAARRGHRGNGYVIHGSSTAQSFRPVHPPESQQIAPAVVKALNAGVDLLPVAYDGIPYYRLFD
jgi:hypothetical protein